MTASGSGSGTGLTVPDTDRAQAAMLNFLVRGVTPLTLAAAGLNDLASELVGLPALTAQIVARPALMRPYTTRCRKVMVAVQDRADELLGAVVLRPPVGPRPQASEGLYQGRWTRVLSPHIVAVANQARWPATGSRAGYWAYGALVSAADVLAHTSTTAADVERITVLAAAHDTIYAALVDELSISVDGFIDVDGAGLTRTAAHPIDTAGGQPATPATDR